MAVALCSFRYPKIRGSELVSCAVVDQVGWLEMWVFRIPVFFKSVRSCCKSILPVPNVVSQHSNKRANSLGANSCSPTRNGVSPSLQPIPLKAPVFENEKPKRWAPNFSLAKTLLASQNSESPPDFLKANPKIWKSFSNPNPDLNSSLRCNQGSFPKGWVHLLKARMSAHDPIKVRHTVSCVPPALPSLARHPVPPFSWSCKAG